MLVRQSQLLEQEKAPIGRPDTDVTHAIGCASVGGSLIRWCYVTPVQTPQCALNRLDLAPESFIIFMPNLTTQEAAALASKVNGPFTSDAVADTDLINASIAGSGIATSVASKALMHGLPQVTNAGEYNAYLYVSHQ